MMVKICRISRHRVMKSMEIEIKGRSWGQEKHRRYWKKGQFWAYNSHHCGDRGEVTCKGIERAQIILLGRESAQRGEMTCANTVPLKPHCSEAAD